MSVKDYESDPELSLRIHHSLIVSDAAAGRPPNTTK